MLSSMTRPTHCEPHALQQPGDHNTCHTTAPSSLSLALCLMVSKIKDGLFLGDVEASQDPEFIELNKITRIVNCATGQVRADPSPPLT